MTLRFRFAAIVVLYSVLCWTTGASADPIRVTAGTVEVTRLGFGPTAIDLSGDRGFSIQAIASFGGLFGPGIDCFDGCVSGETVDVRASWTGSDVNGTATLDGTVYKLGGVHVDAFVTVGFLDNNVVIPELGEPSLALTVPFIFDGAFTHGMLAGNMVRESLEGSGRVTMFLERAFVPTAGTERYVLLRTVYEFDETAPVPEPGTLVLVGTVGAMALARRMRRSFPSAANGRR